MGRRSVLLLNTGTAGSAPSAFRPQLCGICVIVHAWLCRIRQPIGREYQYHVIPQVGGTLLLAERYYVTFGLCSEPSVCRPSVVCRLSVTLLHPRQRIELFGNIIAPSNCARTGTVCIKILGDRTIQIQGNMKIWRFSTNILKTVRDTAIVTIEDYRNFCGL